MNIATDIILCLLLILSMFFLMGHSEDKRNLNYIIQEQQEELYRKRMEVRSLWVLKNQAWKEMARRK